MTDPKTVYERRDSIQAVDHDRIATIYRLAWLLLPAALGALFAAGGAWMRIADHETRIAVLTAEMRVVERLSNRADEKLENQSETLRRIEKLLEEMRRSIPPQP